MELENYVGKRLLLKLSGSQWNAVAVTEYKLLEVSPSGNWLKLMSLTGQKFWRAVADVAFVEELKDMGAPK